jgi:hypothetical protein
MEYISMILLIEILIDVLIYGLEVTFDISSGVSLNAGKSAELHAEKTWAKIKW